jgi:ABC-2 type transport system permease protein
MQPSLAPGWIGTVAAFNPVDWAATAARGATAEAFDWSAIAGRIGLLAGLTVIAAWLATRAFAIHQRSL